MWERELENYPHKFYKWFVLGGIKNGFRIPKIHPAAQPFVVKFKQRVPTDYERVTIGTQLQKWLKAGVIAEVADISNVHFQPVHTIPKGDPTCPRGSRLIVNNSFPEGSSVNDIIPEDQKKCALDTFQTVVAWLLDLGRNAWLAVMDLSDAWKQLRTHPLDVRMLGFVWEDTYFVDLSLSFGLATAVRIFCIVDMVLEWCFRNRIPEKLRNKLCHRFILMYIDDYSTGARTLQGCRESFKILQQLVLDLGLQYNPQKNQEPTQTPRILGFCYNMCELTVSIPYEKIQRFLRETDNVVKASTRAINADKLERLLGVMSHFSDALWCKRVLLQSGYTLLHYPKSGRKKAGIDA